MSETPIYPTAREIAVAIVTAARIHVDDPVFTAKGMRAMRGRWLAVAALQEAFPESLHDWIARACGVMGRSRCQNARAEIRSKRFGREHNRAKWFLEADLEKVKSSLASAIAETDTELRNRMTAAVANPAAVTATPLPGTGGDIDPAPPIMDAHDRQFSPAPELTKNPPSATAHALADFQRSRITKTASARVIDWRQDGYVNLGDPPPGRSALDQRGRQ